MPTRPNRTNPRASRYDYSSPGMYFVTICTKDREHYFGEVVDGIMVLSEIGKVCDEQISIMLQKRLYVDMHEYVIMPNHVHLLMGIGECRDTGLPCPHDTTNTKRTPQADVPTQPTLGSIVGGRKSAVSRECHKQGHTFARQSRYHDHIVRNQTSYDQIKRYISNNPHKRTEDRFYSG